MDAETGDNNHTLVAFRCDGFNNPSTQQDNTAFEFTLTTQRYTYNMGPLYILE